MRNNYKLIQFSIFLLVLISGLLIIGGRACSKQSGGGSNRVGSSSGNPFTLNAPSRLTAITMSTTRIDLSWTDNSPNAMGFEIERSLITNTAYTLLATVTRGINIYYDTSVTPLNTYYYRVRAFNPIGDRSDWSNEVSITINLEPVWSAIEAGYVHTLARSTDGTLWSWGYNPFGELGLGDYASRDAPALIVVDFDNNVFADIVQMSAGGGNLNTVNQGHTLALKSDGTIWSWGRNYYGQLGLGDFLDAIAPLRIGQDSDWSGVIAGGWYSIALKTNNTLWAWGDNNFGQLGLGNSGDTINVPNPVGTTSDWSQVAAGENHTIALKTNGTIWAWGYNGQGRLGLGDNTDRNTPGQIGTDSDWSGITAGRRHSIALKTNNTLWAWGYNSYGQLGLGNSGIETGRTTPTQIGSASDWSGVTVGVFHSIALRTNNTLWAWGYNSYGALGLGDNTDRNTPSQIGTDSDWSGITAGGEHAIALKTNNTLWAWGYNGYGQLGLGDRVNRNIPYPLGSPATPSLAATSLDLSQIVITWTNNFNKATGFIMERGITNTNYSPIATFGANTTSYLDTGLNPANTYYYRVYAYNNLGNSPYSIVSAKFNQFAPSSLIVKVISSSRIDLSWTDNSSDETGFSIERRTLSTDYSLLATVSAGTTSYSDSNFAPDTTIIALTNYSYRIRAFNTLGDSPSSNMVKAAIDYNLLPTWSAIAAGESHTIARATDGTLWSWGDNSNSQLGLGDAANRLMPTPIGIGTNWQAFGCGQIHSFALKSASGGSASGGTDRTLWTWGSNEYGQLGMGNIINNGEPFPVGSDSDWSQLTAGAVHTFGLKTNPAGSGTGGTLWGWGDNQFGELGLIQGDQILTPTQMGTDSDWSAVVARGGLDNTYTLARKTNGTLWSWGWNESGQLGRAGSGAIPGQIGTDSDWASASSTESPALVAGEAHSLALKTDGTLWSWGSNSSGQLGLGDNSYSYWDYSNLIYVSKERNTPTQVGTDSDWVTIAAGGIHSLAMKTNPAGGGTGGTLWSWGDNSYGQLGLGDAINRNTPTQIGTDSDWSIIAAGGNHSLGIKTNGILWVWGRNDSGQLGLGDISYGYNKSGVDGDPNKSIYTYINTDRNIPCPLGSPAPPFNLVVTAVSSAQINLSWTDNSYNESGFKIERSVNTNTNYTLLGTVGSVDSPIITAVYSDITSTGFAPNTAYYYRVRAYNTFGESPYSNEVTPITSTAQAMAYNRIDLSWTSVIAAQSYLIERGTIAGGPYTTIATIGATVDSYSDLMCSPLTTYYYRIYAYYAGGNTLSSVEANATTPLSPPDAPLTPTAQAISPFCIVITWTNVISETGYYIERKLGASGTYEQIANRGTDVITYSDTTVVPIGTYYYQVRAYNAGGTSDPSPGANATPQLPPPVTLTATAVASDRINLTWTDVTGETGYKIYRSPDNITFTQIATPTMNSTSYPDSGLSASTAYYYYIISLYAGVESTISTTANNTMTVPITPSGLAATVFSSSQINLSWTGVTGADGYKIEHRIMTDTNYTPLDPVGSDPTSYSDTDLAPTTIYYYRIRAFNAGGDSGYSEPVSATTTAATTPPGAPGALTATAISSTRISLTGKNVTAATDFQIERSSPDESSYSPIGTTGTGIVTYTDSTGLTSWTRYYYKVWAHNNAGYSSEAASANTWTLLPAPGTLTATTLSSSQIALTWTNVTGETGGYKIERSCKSIEKPLSNNAPTISYGGTRTMGYRFKPNVNGQITALGRFIGYYATVGNTTVSLWNDTVGTAIVTATVSSAVGWQWATLATPITVMAGTYYRVSVDCPISYWAMGYTFPVTKTDIYIDSSVLDDGSGLGFPGNTNTTTMYGWADIEFIPGYTQIGTTDTNVVTYTDTTVTGSHTYYYRVRATNADGDGDESPEANATTAGNWSTTFAVSIDAPSAFIGCKTNGTLWIWGGSDAPSQVGTGTNWFTVAAGAGDSGSYFFARQTNSTLWSWGNNFNGQLGLNDTNDRVTPTQILGSTSDWSQVACGFCFTVAIKTNRTIWSCGLNYPGQLGQGGEDIIPHPTFTQIWGGTGTSDWSMVKAGNMHSIALKTNGTIWSWGGNNYFGQLGRSGSPDSPAPVGTASDWSLITTGDYHNAVIKTNGSLWGWGDNEYGQLGLGNTSVSVSTPTQESTNASDWSAVAGGGGEYAGYTLALKTNGSLWAWGSGYSATPSRIGSDTDWSIIKGGALSIARKTNGTVWNVTGSTTTLVGE